MKTTTTLLGDYEFSSVEQEGVDDGREHWGHKRDLLMATK